ncbi:MAG: hypothetical protein QXU32_02440 [Nitrososphaerales archaeon]
MGKRIQSLLSEIQRSYGDTAARIGPLQRSLQSIPTGSLTLDYELGTGGWPLGYLVGVYGPRDIGKSSLIGFNAIVNAQNMGLNCGWLAVEPMGDDNWADWATKNGVDVDKLLITYPRTGEEAFEMLQMMLKSEVIDLVIFDSIGGLLSEVEMRDSGKPRQGGQAGLITWGIKMAAPLAFRNNACVILLNQVRHDMRPGVKGVVYKQPGGEALEHFESIIVQLKRGPTKFTIKEDGNEVVVGQEIVCLIERNKLSEGTRRKAVFNYFHTETDQYPFGIDKLSDIINISKRTGIIVQSGSFFTMPDGKKLQGKAAVAKHLEENPELLTILRESVLEVMLQRRSSGLVIEESDSEDEDIYISEEESVVV